jgi:hypothetical protein
VIKREELSNPRSCMSKAREDEMTFVLLERDAAAPNTIRFWVKERLRLGKNQRGDSQIEEAYLCAGQMEHDVLGRWMKKNCTAEPPEYPASEPKGDEMASGKNINLWIDERAKSIGGTVVQDLPIVGRINVLCSLVAHDAVRQAAASRDELVAALKLAKVRLEICEGRFRGCTDGDTNHPVSLAEIPAWIADIDDLLRTHTSGRTGSSE